MPLSLRDAFDVPYTSSPIEVALEPAHSAIQSLLMLTRSRHAAGVADWVMDTDQAMTPAERKTNNLVLLGLHYVVLPTETWNAFPAYVDHLAALPPEALRDKMLAVYERLSLNPRPEGPMLDLPSALASPESYIAYLRQRFMPDSIDEETEREAYRYVMDPPALQKLVVEHLRHMWKRYLSEEWDHVRPTLQAVVRAYRKVDLKGKSVMEAGRLITGQEIDEEKWSSDFAEARRVVFIPHPHVGPYIPKCHAQKEEMYVFFSARLPDRLAKDAPELSRPEIAIRLSALADDTRLRMLRYLAENGEQRSQGIMEALDLSQSAASRNLTQLSAAGFINERRCDGAKCYALNPERVSDTLQAIASFLSVPERNRS
jgi:DNA-binding transcriptional ArsR family regulator